MSAVEIKPDVLEYKSPLIEQSTEYASITNNSEQTIAFKVKTTAPKFYCVRPNAAIVEPGETVQIQVIFLGLTEEPASDFKCRDKFLVITLPAPYDLTNKNVSEIWNDLESEFKQQAVSKKIKVKYLINKTTQPTQEQQEQKQTIDIQQQQQQPIATEEHTTEEKEPLNQQMKQQQQQEEVKEKPTIVEEKKLIDDESEELDNTPKVAPSTSTTTTTSSDEDTATAKTTSTTATTTTSEGSMNIVPFIVIALLAFLLRWLYS
ncbi:uncharacterized protein NDAI_0A01440 [Naumovozyma dairenensis CBS 421]|uniref:MSP domain-containing protein n=1 Tax=Naumovozyma dairenensis (strain ATCC 10597 / BCRC 20456 / CBS 421 / NBRC 0211 / NRRL Y-12639) TaxID=1071378 RepID=G0W3B4_NAUDC|nr:hypothetical protein NDAI_0A01440 [Naumovozyma dairenensis CBS 421]CCD22302.1 hypothetical protein NDAI_0A01440 [Naumovozyma dairenensis CBS 421]